MKARDREAAVLGRFRMQCQVFRASRRTFPRLRNGQVSRIIESRRRGADFMAAGGRPTVDLEHGVQQRLGVGALGQPAQDVGSRPSSSSMVKPCTSDQARAIAAACSSDSASSAICSWRLAPIAPASPRTRLGGLVQRRPRHIEPLGAEHQPVHAGMRLRIGDIGLGPRHRLLAPARLPAAPAAAIAALNCRKPIAASSLTRPVRSPK